LAAALAAAAGASAPAVNRGRAEGAPAPQRLAHAVVLGAGGRLGSALLAEALVAGRFASVQAWVATPAAQFASALRGLVPLTQARWEAVGGAIDPPSPPASLGADVAFIVFERERFSNGRDDAFVMPDPEALLPMARRLHEGGVRRLLVLLPHAASMLPQALAAGLASHDEAAIADLGFEHLVFFRPSLDSAAAAGAHADGARGRPGLLQRLATWWLSQLRWMVPEREQPLRATVLARLAVLVARLLPLAPQGTRVLPQSLLWQLARDDDGGLVRAQAWLAGRTGSDNPPP
jgi:hypothetical protein